MTKAELISTIVDSFEDMNGEDPRDYVDMTEITLEQADMYLREQRAMERECELEPDECLPNEVTPELYLEAENCYIRYMRHEGRVLNLADYIESEECVCEYEMYCEDYIENPVHVLPVDFLFDNTFPFALNDDAQANPFFLIELGRRSTQFNPNDEYCWYDKEKNLLFSTDTPFADGVIDSYAFAKFILDDADALGYFLNGVMDSDEIAEVFGCEKEALING